MRMIVDITIPHEPFNSLVRSGEAGGALQKCIEHCSPESIYFTEEVGTRAAVMVVEVSDPSRIPHYAEPWFLTFDADCRFRVAMTPEDLAGAGLEALGQKFG